MTKVLKDEKLGGGWVRRDNRTGQTVVGGEKLGALRRHRPASLGTRPKLAQSDTTVPAATGTEEEHIVTLSGKDYLQLQSLIEDPPSINEKTIRAIEAMRRKA